MRVSLETLLQVPVPPVGKVVEITRDENGNLREIYRPQQNVELRYPLRSGDSTKGPSVWGKPELCFAFTLNNQPDCEWAATTGCKERLDFYIK